jgi:hypothetical protein
VIDTYPEEEELVIKCIKQTEQQLRDTFLTKFEVDFDVPFTLDYKVGDNWMEVKEYA